MGEQQDRQAQGVLPLVTIGIPTYNRLPGLKRALSSALGQDYPNVEIVISDNASSDGTEEYCQHMRSTDSRIAYIRQGENQGPERNFDAVLRAARGEYFMWLADDDWIDANYLSTCAQYLSANSEFVLAAGNARYAETDDSDGRSGVNIALLGDSARERIATYYRTVLDNGAFYGVVRRSYLLRLPIRRIMGSDWFMMASLAAWGKVAVLSGTTIHRSAAGISKDSDSMVRYYGLSGWSARQPFAMVALHAAAEVLWRSPVHREVLGLFERAVLSTRVYATIIGRYADLGRTSSIRENAWSSMHRVLFAMIRLLAPIRGARKA